MKNNKQQLNETEKQQYADYVKAVTPTHSLWMNMVRAFLVGGDTAASTSMPKISIAGSAWQGGM